MGKSGSKGVGGHQRPNRGVTDTWLTPPEIINALGTFYMDPCCPQNMPWPTAIFRYEEGLADGLEQPWIGRVWLNPPYGPETGKWLKKLSEHGQGIALIFARTETEMFHRWVWEKADALLFLEGRLHFHYPSGDRAKFNAGAPSVLVAYGESNAVALRYSGIKGKYIELKSH
jgi:hypothetical protein